MNRLFMFFTLFVLVVACNEDEKYFENPVLLSDIKLLKIRADHKTLLPDGQAKMQFYMKAYGIKELPDYTAEYKDEEMDSAFYASRIVCDTFEIPADAIPPGTIKLFDDAGNEIPGAIFSTTDETDRTVWFHAQAGELSSDKIAVKIRKRPRQQYEELIFPVIFHVLNPAEKVGVPSFKITTEAVSKNIERLNNVFNRLVTTDPNGGNARIRFVAAKYNTSGMKLMNEGINNWEISESIDFEDIDDYETYILKYKSSLVYDYRHYLNIWLINYPQGSSFYVKAPNDILPGETIPGLIANEWPVENFPLKPRDVGFFINISSFLNPMSNADFFEISNPMAQFFGLMTTQATENRGTTNLVNGDTDYCPDTYYYWNDGQSVFKNTGKDDKEMNEDEEYFTSYNIMDRYSKKNSITVNQAERIREHIEKCPSRWMYKSRYALTGLRADWDEIK